MIEEIHAPALNARLCIHKLLRNTIHFEIIKPCHITLTTYNNLFEVTFKKSLRVSYSPTTALNVRTFRNPIPAVCMNNHQTSTLEEEINI